jgi:hypothetical protein
VLQKRVGPVHRAQFSVLSRSNKAAKVALMAQPRVGVRLWAPGVILRGLWDVPGRCRTDAGRGRRGTWPGHWDLEPGQGFGLFGPCFGSVGVTEPLTGTLEGPEL